MCFFFLARHSQLRVFRRYCDPLRRFQTFINSVSAQNAREQVSSGYWVKKINKKNSNKKWDTNENKPSDESETAFRFVYFWESERPAFAIGSFFFFFFLIHTHTSLGRAQIAGLEFSFFTPIDRVHWLRYDGEAFFRVESRSLNEAVDPCICETRNLQELHFSFSFSVGSFFIRLYININKK